MVSNPDLIKEVLNLPKDPALYHVVEWFLGDGLVTAGGEVWKYYRKAITPLFHFGVLTKTIPSNAQCYINFSVMQSRIESWIEDIKLHEGKQYEAFDLFEHLTCGIIIDLAFGKGFDVEWMHSR